MPIEKLLTKFKGIAMKLMRSCIALALWVTTLLLTACGGGGGSSPVSGIPASGATYTFSGKVYNVQGWLLTAPWSSTPNGAGSHSTVNLNDGGVYPANARKAEVDVGRKSVAPSAV